MGADKVWHLRIRRTGEADRTLGETLFRRRGPELGEIVELAALSAKVVAIEPRPGNRTFLVDADEVASALGTAVRINE